MFNLLGIIDLGAKSEHLDDLARLLSDRGPSLPGVGASILGKTLPRALNGGHLLWRLAFGSEQDYWACRSSAAWQSEIVPALSPDHGIVVDWAAYRAELFARSSRTSPGIWRCLLMSVDAGASATAITQYERDLMLMPETVTAIRSWALGHVVASEGRRRWTHIWEQEFDDVAGLEGEYMTRPIHWGVVDGWFDPECPQRIVDPFLVHAAIDIQSAVIRS